MTGHISNRERTKEAFAPIGRSLARAALVHGRSFTGNSWAEAQSWLRGDVVINLPCGPAPRGRWGHHEVTLHPDGTFSSESHSSTIHDLPAERLLSILSGQEFPACLEMIDALPAQEGADLEPCWGKQTRTLLRVLHAAARWSHQPDVDWECAAPIINAGLTPHLWGEWVTAGWSWGQAEPFLKAHVSPEMALLWRDCTGGRGRRVALASRGANPRDDAAWDATGMGLGTIALWRDPRNNIEPQDAAFLHLCDITPEKWRQSTHAGGRGQAGYYQRYATPDLVRAWRAAGGPVTPNIIRWIRGILSMADAVEYHRLGITPIFFRSSTTGLLVYGKPKQVGAWISIGLDPKNWDHCALSNNIDVEPSVLIPFLSEDIDDFIDRVRHARVAYLASQVTGC